MRNAAIIAGVVLFVGAVGYIRMSKSKEVVTSRASDDAALADASEMDRGDGFAPAELPRMVDLGSTVCASCKKMAPIIDELREHYKGRACIEFVDVKKSPSAYQLYAIKVIPTQIFYNAEGVEVWRHEGFFSKEEIVAKFKELGVDD